MSEFPAPLKDIQEAQVRFSPVPMAPLDLLNRAIAQGAGIEVLARLMDLVERWETNQARKAFDAAMANAKAEMPVIIKNKTVSFGAGKTSYQHEDLAEIARTVDPVLGKEGLSYRFNTDSQTIEGKVVVTCIVSHRDGHSERNSLSAAYDTSGSKNSIQALGSAVTYLQRYTLKAALGLAAAVDDDAVGAMQNGLTEEQVEQLRTAIMDAGLAVETFNAAYNIPNFERLPAAKLQHALDRCAKWKKAMAEKK